MSIFFDFPVGFSGRKFRRAIDLDKYEIELIREKEHVEAIFGDVDIGELIELATLAICLINAERKVIGFMALRDYPNVATVPASGWKKWIRNMYRVDFHPHNTMFIHMMCCVETEESFLDEALKSVFNNDEYLLYIVLTVPSTCTHDEVSRYKPIRNHVIKKLVAQREDSFKQTIYVAHRQDFYPRLVVRAAVEEDNDDVVEILDKLNPTMRKLYGDFYISEIIGRHPESARKVVVAQQHDTAVGVICLNSQIDYAQLSRTFDLTPYHGLRKASVTEKEEIKSLHSSDMVLGIRIGKRSPFESALNLSENRSSKPRKPKIKKTEKNKPDEQLSHVNFHNNSAQKMEDTIFVETGKGSDDCCSDKLSMDSCDPSFDVLPKPSFRLEEDQIDYDIVNIDSSLMVLPSVVPSHDDKSYWFWHEIDDKEESEIKQHKPKFSKNKNKKHALLQKNLNKMMDVHDKGEPNAFSIEIYALRDDIDERKGYDLLVASFEIMKNYDYCILRLPTECASNYLLRHFCLLPPKIKACSEHALYIAHRSSVCGKGYDLLVASFEIMKNYDYCILRLPTECASNYLLRHFCLLPPKIKACSEHALYIAHRSSVCGTLSVRKAEVLDIPQISQMMLSVHSKKAMQLVEESILEENEDDPYVFVCGNHIIGYGILEPPEHLKFLQVKYNMDPYHIDTYHHAGQGIYYGFSQLKAAVVYPVFEVHFRFFMREMMTLSGSDTLIWLTGYRDQWVTHKANSLALAMVPLLPRRSEPTSGLVTELAEIENIEEKTMAFNSWILISKLTSVPRMNIHSRIVIVGASRTAMGFINTLLFSDQSSSYLTFTDVTLVSTYGLPRGVLKKEEPCAETMFPRHHTTTEEFLKNAPYTYYLNLVEGTMVEINKQDNYIATSSGDRYYYDKLFLMCGRQYQHPDYLKAVLERERSIRLGIRPSYTRMDDPSRKEPQITTTCDTPRNLFIINTVPEARKALGIVRKIIRKMRHAKIIVYGLTLETYCCITALQETGVPANNILFVEPFPPENPRKPRIPVFNNCHVDQKISEVFEDIGLNVYRSFYFHAMKTDAKNLITHVSFFSHFQMVELECAAMFYYGSKDIDADAFRAIHKSGLLYDKGILIDHKFRTQKNSIYAAGPATRYNARYFSEMRRHCYFDSYEVGEKLGLQIRIELDPLFSEKIEYPKNSVQPSVNSLSFDSTSTVQPSINIDEETYCKKKPSKSKFHPDESETLPQLVTPIMKHCLMPGGWQYLEVRSPGWKIPHPYVQCQTFVGSVMETYESGYFKLHLTKDSIVDGITCLTPIKQSIAHFKALYGKSAVLLNNVHIKYAAKKVNNFYEFFNSKGIMFLYHENVDELFAMVKELFPMGDPEGETLSEGLLAASAKFQKSSLVRRHFGKFPHVAAITSYIMEWLTQNALLLPMYRQPSTNIEQ